MEEMNRAFSADILGKPRILGRCPRLAMNAAPVALTDAGWKTLIPCGKIDLDQFDSRLGLRSLALSKL
jgi:hypothetical protein